MINDDHNVVTGAQSAFSFACFLRRLMTLIVLKSIKHDVKLDVSGNLPRWKSETTAGCQKSKADLIDFMSL